MWSDGVPNLLIGLRQGIEGGLVVSILLAAVRRSPERLPPAPVWFGVLAAGALALSFGGVLTYSQSELSTRAPDGFGGVLSIGAVGLVTAMIFWMGRVARSLSGDVQAKATDAVRIGAVALALTAFIAVGREGLATALLLWTAVRAAGESAVPLIGAALGIALATLLCWLIYRSAVKINRGVFFSRAAIALIIIAAGVLSSGLGELQSAGLLPGQSWRAFDLSATISADAWWVMIVRGVTNLAPSMTWLQVVAYLAYLGVVLAAFLRMPGSVVASPPRGEAAAGAAEEAGAADETQASRRVPSWAVAAAAMVALVLVAGGFAVWAQSAPGGTGRREVTIAATAGSGAPGAPPAVLPLAAQELGAPLAAYQGYVADQLGVLAGQVDTLKSAVAAGELPAARAAWEPAQLTWQRVGAAYGSFGDLSDAIDGSPRGLPDGAADKDFGGLRRLEYGLWHGQDAATLAPIADKLVADVAALRQKLPTVTVDPAALPVRAHEILEDSLRFQLAGLTDQGAGTAYPETLASVDGTRVVLERLAPVLAARKPDLVPTIQAQLAVLEQAVRATRHGDAWATPKTASLAERQQVNAAVGNVLETLSLVPDLLQIRQN